MQEVLANGQEVFFPNLINLLSFCFILRVYLTSKSIIKWRKTKVNFNRKRFGLLLQNFQFVLHTIDVEFALAANMATANYSVTDGL